jgi:hypothetical protein
MPAIVRDRPVAHHDAARRFVGRGRNHDRAPGFRLRDGGGKRRDRRGYGDADEIGLLPWSAIISPGSEDDLAPAL